ncbi:conserved membrane hypothetical protein [Candidatus Sulfotelmatobacter kueseliae]|uniref:DUF1634 domain-containing protein n=1 Tax=Candidatus Sulfotelmatobacter kueseliae TaxID=2042962 RepID=A0A2U3L9H8_9BACT|nr:conserved membrane hypothetical protein [Candidatus Sulfotelmatobacter kueseliae]
MRSEPKWTDERIENVVANLLRAGVLLSALIVLIGACLYMVRHGHSPVAYRVFRGEPADLRGVRGIIHDTMSLRGRGIIQLGLLVLIATPVTRVAFSVFGFAKEGDRMYVVFTVIVFSILVYSLLGS